MGLIAFCIFPIFGAACGSLLGIDDPTDRDASLARDVKTETSLTCTAGQKVCSGICVAKNDPSVGCGEGCSACAGGVNAAPSCVLTNDVFRCGISCNPGFGSCGITPSGCSARLDTIKYCGSCTNNCRADGGADFCVPAVGGPTCSRTCASPNKVCGMECVDPMTNPKACGAGCQDCTLMNGTGTCVAGVCKVACNPHFCGPSCAASTDSLCWSPTGCVSCSPGQQCDLINGGCVSSVCSGSDLSCGPPAGPCVDCTPSGHCVSQLCSYFDGSPGDAGCGPLGTRANCGFCGDDCFASPCCFVGSSYRCGNPPLDSGPTMCL